MSAPRPTSLQGGRQPVGADCEIGLRIQKCALERTERQVALLRRDHDAGAVGHAQAAACARPQAGKHAHQDRLSSARFAADVYRLAGRSREVGVCDQRSAAAVGNGEIDERHRRCRRHPSGATPACTGISPSMASQAVDDIHHAPRGGVPLGHAIVVVDHPGDGDLHLDEGGGELRDLAQRQVARRDTWGQQTAAGSSASSARRSW